MRVSVPKFAVIVAAMLIFFVIAGTADRIVDGLLRSLPAASESNLDVQYQEGIWRANNATSMLTALELVAGAFAVGLLLFTFRETRRAANASVRATEAVLLSNKLDFQPYILAVSAEVENYGLGASLPPSILSLAWRLKIKNTGRNPARDLIVSINSISAGGAFNSPALSTVDGHGYPIFTRRLVEFGSFGYGIAPSVSSQFIYPNEERTIAIGSGMSVEGAGIAS